MEDLDCEFEKIREELKNARYNEMFSRRNEEEHKKAKEHLNEVRKKLAKLKTKMYEERNGIRK